MKTKLPYAIAVAIAAMFALSACNTTAGFGQDVENTGEYIEEKAEDNS